MHKKLLSIVFSCCLIFGLTALASPAQASHQTVDSVASLMPNDGFADKDQLSDANDGLDSTAHLTAVTDPAADRVIWWVCDANTGPPGTGSATCSEIGSDTTGVQPDLGDDGDPDTTDAAGEAYEYNWDIPSAFDSDITGTEFDIWVFGCLGAPDDATDLTAATNCDSSDGNDVEDDIYLDDGATSSNVGPFADHSAIPTGEIALYCTGGEGGGSPEECDEIAEGQTFDHGTELPQTDFAVGFSTSDDVTQASACIDDFDNDEELEEADDAGWEPEGCDEYPNVVVQVNEDSDADVDPGRTWIAYFDDSDAINGGDFEVAIFGVGDDDAGECWTGGDFFGDDDGQTTIVSTDADGNTTGFLGEGAGLGINEALDVCVFDEHYSANADRVVASIDASFDDTDVDDDGCDTTDEEESVYVNTNIAYADDHWDDDPEEIEGCLYDQNGELINDDELVVNGGDVAGQPVWELTGDSAELDDTSDCDSTDEVDDDFTGGQNDTAVCDDTGYDETDEYSSEITALFDDSGDILTGTNEIVFCVDQEADDLTDAEFGCADEAESVTLTKNVVGEAQDVEIVFQTEGADPADPCAGGDTFRENNEGDSDTLVICTYDKDGNLVTTDEEILGDDGDDDDDNGTLDIESSDESIIAFTGNRPDDTGADGTATTGIRAVGEGSATITVDLLTVHTGGDSDSVTKLVNEGVGVQQQCNDGVDNDGDGAVDYPNDLGCSDINDNTENSDQPGETFTHARTAKITGFKHIQLPGKDKPALRVKGTVNAPDYSDCHAFVPVKIQLRASGEWITRKTDVTNENGRWSVLIRHVKGKYRVVATRFELVDNANNLHVCQRARDEASHKH